MIEEYFYYSILENKRKMMLISFGVEGK